MVLQDVPHHQNPPLTRRQVDQFLTLRHFQGQGLFNEDIFAR